MDVIVWIGKLIWFFLPAGLANMSPVLVKKYWLGLAKPIDGGVKLWGESLFGAHKTWRGLLVGTIAGGVLFGLQKSLAIAHPIFQNIAAYDYRALPWWFGFLFGFAAIFGDLMKSFFKRRFHIPDGAMWFPFDQVDFYVTSAFVLGLFVSIDAISWFIILSLGIIVHIGVNRIGYKLKVKDTPW